MSILSYLKSVFSYKNEKTTAIITLNDLIQIPSRSFFNDDQKMLALIDKYKSMYRDLVMRKTVSPFYASSLSEEIRMNLELLLKYALEDTPATFDDYQIHILKIKLCSRKLDEIQNDLIARLIALKELHKSFFSPHKRNIIKNEIDSLTSNLLVVTNQKRAVSLEIEAFINRINTASLSKEKKLNIRNFENINAAQKFIPEILTKINNTNLDDYTKAALLESELEKYAFSHQAQITKLKAELTHLENELLHARSAEHLMEKIAEIEKSYYFFLNYGRNLVTDEDFTFLYEVKFKILTFDCGYFDCHVHKRGVSTKEFKVYQEIVFRKIESIVKGENTNVRTLFGKKLSYGVSLITKMLKNGERSFSPATILASPYLLNLLLAFDTPDGLKNFFDKYTVDKMQYNINYFSGLFKWQTHLPLATYCKLFILNDISNDLTKLYAFVKEDEDTYHLPDGLLEVIYDEYRSEKEQFIVDKMREKAQGKRVIFPSSLRKIQGNIFKGCDIKDFILNEGLCSISSNFFDGHKLETIIIPHTLERFPSFDPTNLKKVVFQGYECSPILNNDIQLRNFIIHTFFKEDTGNVMKVPFEEKSGQRQLAYESGRYCHFYLEDIMANEYEIEFYIYANFNILEFQSINGDLPIVIDFEDDKIRHTIRNRIPKYHDCTPSLTLYDARKVADHINNILKVHDRVRTLKKDEDLDGII